MADLTEHDKPALVGEWEHWPLGTFYPDASTLGPDAIAQGAAMFGDRSHLIEFALTHPAAFEGMNARGQVQWTPIAGEPFRREPRAQGRLLLTNETLAGDDGTCRTLLVIAPPGYEGSLGRSNIENFAHNVMRADDPEHLLNGWDPLPRYVRILTREW